MKVTDTYKYIFRCANLDIKFKAALRLNEDVK